MASRTEKILQSWLPVGFFILVVMASIADIATDLSQGAKLPHLLQEAIILLMALFILYRLYLDGLSHRKQNKRLREQVAEYAELSKQASAELSRAKKEFGEVIAKQFSDWQLTESEKQVSWLLLKGFNSKEIANLRELSDKTVRNQLSSVYKKSALRGKQAFIAWFMDGLFE
ncbi:helix-turn-helix transcriptional regulator [Shewanella salipaludis]|uniref:DNA-binding response regulator n=1 Tax=Shewanella salipaludis TaxID=2723052 RepID=A0A972FV16_9GAMM|nr:LuxR C-terminal-related transcriptional regulator [Shewanella salipaludis]NMH66640.1 DNA-binding response regulator [Shewanella salipaludis]